MARVWADRVKQTSTITGTGSYNLDATVPTGFQGFVAAWATGNSGYYLATDGTDWEVGDGTVTDATPDTLSRDTILASSNGDAAVSWSAADVTIVAVHPADNMRDMSNVTVDSTGRVGIGDTTPDYWLDILDSTGTPAKRVLVNLENEGGTQIQFVDTAATNGGTWRIGKRNATDDFEITRDLSGEVEFLVESGGIVTIPGRLGIGSSSGIGLLAVNATNIYMSVSDDTAISDEASVSLESVVDGGTEGVLRIYTSAQEYGEFQIRGSSNAVVEIQDPQSVFVTTDTDTNYCVLSDGDGTYSLKNRIGASRSFTLVFEGRA